MADYYLRATDSNLVTPAGAFAYKQLTRGLPDTASTVAVDLTSLQTRDVIGFTNANIPNKTGTLAGSFTVELDVATGNSQVFASVAVARVSSTGTQGATSAFTAEQSTNGGLLTFAVTTPTLGTWLATDRLRVTYRFRNSQMANRSIVLNTGTVDTVTTAPWVEIPVAPTSLVATGGNGSASLTWTAPGNDGGGAITGYQYRVSTNAGSTWGTEVATGSTGTSFNVTGLTNGTAHVFQVRAVNSAGNGDWSATSNSVTPAAPSGGSGAVVLVTATGGGSAPVLSAPSAWAEFTIDAAPGGAPAFSGGSSTTVAVTPTGGGVTGRAGGAATTVTTTAVGSGSTGRTGGAQAVVAVAASGGGVNPASLNSDPSAWVEFTIDAQPAVVAPGVPTGLSVTPGDGQGVHTFTAPADPGSGITGYEVEYELVPAEVSGGSSVVVPISATGAGSSGRAGGSGAVVGITATGGGTTARSGGSSASVGVTTNGGGSTGRSGGSSATVGVTSTGAGDGSIVIAKSGGSIAVVSVAVAGGGTTGRKGGSSATVMATVAGAGVAARFGGSSATVTIDVAGGGFRLGGVLRDISISVAGSVIRDPLLYTVTPSPLALRVSAVPVAATVAESTLRDVLTASGSTTKADATVTTVPIRVVVTESEHHLVAVSESVVDR